jgi:geranylgeranyl diphosphate synthase type I
VSTSPVAETVAAHLDEFVARVRRDDAEYGPDAALFLDAAAATLQGGKRLRARFCHDGWAAVAHRRAADAVEPASLWGLCAALEIFQSAALVHDDLIDNSDTRRGRPASHRALEASHRAAGWSGDAEAFGRASAVLLGDLLVAWSDDLLEESMAGEAEAEAEAGRVRAEYARMRRDVTVGQMLDIAEESAWSVGPPAGQLERALRVASLKSARYSIEQPLVLGAVLAGADAEQLAVLRAFGRPVGMAFQLRDDLLGVFGDASVTGKPAGDDLREGKRTALIAIARERLDADDQRMLDAALGDVELSAQRIGEIQELIAATGAPEHVEQLITDYAERADSALRDAPLDAAAVTDLRALATAATSRSA